MLMKKAEKKQVMSYVCLGASSLPVHAMGITLCRSGLKKAWLSPWEGGGGAGGGHAMLPSLVPP